MKKILALFMLLFPISYLYSQKQGPELIDSLKSGLTVAAQDTVKVSLLGKLSFQYYKFDTDSGIYYAEQAISLAEKLNWVKGIAFSWNYLGTNYAVKGNYPKALECFHNSLAKYNEIGDKQGIAFISNNLGNLYRILKQYVKAEEFVYKATLINTALKNKIDLTKNYDNLGCIYYETSEYSKSDSCYQLGLSIAKEINNKDLVAQLLINLSENRVKLKDFCGALELGIEAIKISEELTIPYDGASYNGYVGEIYLKLSGDSAAVSDKCRFHVGNKQAYLQSAKKYLVKSIALLENIEDLSMLSESSLLLSRVYERLGDSENALKYYKIYSSNKDSVFSKDNSLKLANLEKNREVELRDNQIKIQTLEIGNKNEQIRSQIVLFLFVLLVIILLFYFYYKKGRATELRKSEERYRTIFENLQDVFYQIDLTGRVIDISPSIERFSDFKREEVVGSSVFNFYADPGDREKFISTILKDGEVRDYELIIKTKSSEKFVSINAQLIYGPDGKSGYITGAMRDVSARKKAETELQESKEKFEKDLIFLNSIFESPIDIIIFALDRNYCYTAFTQFHKKTMKMIWGIEIHIGMNMLDNIPSGTDREKAKRNFDRALKGEYFIETEEYGDESLLRTFYEDYYSSIKSSDGEIVGVSVFVIDVTYRRKAEKQLKLLSKAIEQSPVNVVITNKKGVIEYVNPNFTEVTGYTSEEAIGKNPRILQSGKQSKEFYKELWNTILAGENWIGEFCNKKKNGDLYDESAIISPIFNTDGEISHFVEVKSDITEKKKMVEDLIKARDQAQESDELKTAFLNNISHEIRTPFNGILGFLSMLQYDDVSASDRDEYIGIINKSADRLMSTINDIVEISQIQTGQVKMIESEIIVRKLCNELVELFQSEAEIQGLNFVLRNDLPETIESITTDRFKLFAILSNLIGNAIKFTKAGLIEVSICRKGDKLEFAVSDTGIGIPEDKRSAIFERFMQADISSTRKFEGAGLGLTISKAYSEMLGGELSVHSQMGIGSVFCLTLPFTDDRDEMKVTTNVSSGLGFKDGIEVKDSGLKILIAEDDEQSAILIEISLKPFSKNIITVRTGYEAVEACRNNPDIALVFMDIKMPEIDGYEATRQIRQFNAEVVIIAQTAYALSSDRDRAIRAGCNDYIAKPMKKEHLIEVFHKYFK
jgi:hypothetical protein